MIRSLQNALGAWAPWRVPSFRGSAARAQRRSVRLQSSGRVFVLLLALWACMSIGSAANAEIVDDFETIADWKFNNGPEFPGAEGDLSFRPLEDSQAIYIRFDFTEGGAYVAAKRPIADMPAVLLRFHAMVPAGARLAVHVQDSTDQWLEYDVHRPLSSLDDRERFVGTIDLGDPQGYSKGAADGIVHQPLKAIAFYVNKLDLEMGAVAVDNLELFQDPALDFTEPGWVAPVGTERCELAINHSEGEVFDRAVEMGARWVRTDMFWNRIEKTPGVYDFSQLDARMDLLEDRGLGAILILDYGNDLYDDGAIPVARHVRDAFIAFSRAAASHFASRKVRFEFWNEPDNHHWTPSDPVVYAEVAKEVIAAVHDEQPSASISTAGLSWFNFPFLQTMLDEGAADQADAVGMHAYRKQNPPETLSDDVARSRSMLRNRLSREPPIWLTEWGYASIPATEPTPFSRAQQAVFTVRALLSMTALELPVGTIYTMIEDGSGYGLVQENMEGFPAYFALRAHHELTADLNLEAKSQVGGYLVQALKFGDERKEVLVLWSPAEHFVPSVTVPTPDVAHGMYGDEIPISDSYDLHSTDGPIYLSYFRNGGSQPTGGAPGSGGTIGSNDGEEPSGSGATKNDEGDAESGGSGDNGETDDDKSPDTKDDVLSEDGEGAIGAGGVGEEDPDYDYAPLSGTNCGCSFPGTNGKQTLWSSVLFALLLIQRTRRGRSGRAE